MIGVIDHLNVGGQEGVAADRRIEEHQQPEHHRQCPLLPAMALWPAQPPQAQGGRPETPSRATSDPTVGLHERAS
jgi:hypothetical protein